MEKKRTRSHKKWCMTTGGCALGAFPTWCFPEFNSTGLLLCAVQRQSTTHSEASSENSMSVAPPAYPHQFTPSLPCTTWQLKCNSCVADTRKYSLACSHRAGPLDDTACSLRLLNHCTSCSLQWCDRRCVTFDKHPVQARHEREKLHVSRLRVVCSTACASTACAFASVVPLRPPLLQRAAARHDPFLALCLLV